MCGYVKYVLYVCFFFLEHLDFMNTVDTSEMFFNQFRQVEHDYIGYQSLTDVPKALVYMEEETKISVRVLYMFHCRILLKEKLVYAHLLRAY